MATNELPTLVRLALDTLLNHIQPGWENCTTVVRAWLAGAGGLSSDEEKELALLRKLFDACAECDAAIGPGLPRSVDKAMVAVAAFCGERVA